MPSPKWLLYGSYGYTGRLIVEEIERRRRDCDRSDLSVIEPILGGRHRASVEKMSDQMGYPCRVFNLDDIDEIVHRIHDVDVVLNCAGPFSATAVAMIEACLKAGVHYLDITGEIAAIEEAAGRGRRAEEAGVTLMPAVGFDVVPSDCLAVKLAERLPDANPIGFKIVLIVMTQIVILTLERLNGVMVWITTVMTKLTKIFKKYGMKTKISMDLGILNLSLNLVIRTKVG
ncbi:MAG: saccharopine dehydrogenase NADP-binding domain-containing protein [Pirellulales bacterium]|nr:saccharopine dehydrogenase NADP-binding domain-containing protein [Pirellulales bacterium]